MTNGHALVLGGGGVAGIAWITGLLAGLADAGQDVSGADVIIGTSAGANVAAQVGSGLSLEELLARQVEPARQSRELMAVIDWDKFGADLQQCIADAGTPVFDAASGVSLVEAVAASSAVPGIWPPVTINGRRYMDGGVRSADNADLAAGAARVVVVSPLGMDSPLPTSMPLREVLTSLKDGGATVTVISPDEASLAAIGTNALDPATRVPAAAAGLAQGRAGLPPAF
jgi:NTE family protein